MAQITTGVRRILGLPFVYRSLQSLLGAARTYRRITDEHLRLGAGDRMLDIGCGPGAIVEYVPAGVDYCGFDVSAEYIEEARRRFGNRGQFWAERVSAATVARLPAFDVALGFAILHHLDDAEADQLFALAHQALRPGGRLVTYDPCIVEGQARIARWLVSRDRGQNVRGPEEYAALARRHFAEVDVIRFEGHLRVPYSAVVLECRKV